MVVRGGVFGVVGVGQGHRRLADAAEALHQRGIALRSERVVEFFQKTVAPEDEAGVGDFGEVALLQRLEIRMLLFNTPEEI